MIDKPARTKMAELARHLVAGIITNDEFEDRLPESADPAIQEIFYLGFWPLYSDSSEHRLIGDHAVHGGDRREAARFILFLESHAAYRWPIYPRSFRHALYDLFSLGRFSRTTRNRFEALCATVGDVDVWPFLTKSDYESALQKPPYLHA
jgi:hypothetical protein